MVKYIYADDDDSKDLAVIQDQAIGAPQENQEEPKKRVTIVNVVRKTAQVSFLPPQKPNENSSTRKETKKSSDKGKRKNKSVLIKRPPRIVKGRNEVTSKSAEHSFKPPSDHTAQKSAHSTAFKSIPTGSFTLEPSIREEVQPLPRPVVLTNKPRRERFTFEDEESYDESMGGIMIDQTRPRQSIVQEEESRVEEENSKEKKKTKGGQEEKGEGKRKKLTDIEEVSLYNIGK